MLSAIYTTVSCVEEAKRLANQAVEEKVALCVNIIPHGVSVYQWEGSNYEENECFLIFKTETFKKEELLSWLKEKHPYKVPVILDGEVNVNSSYLKAMT